MAPLAAEPLTRPGEHPIEPGSEQGVIEQLRRYARPDKRRTLDGVTAIANDGCD